MNWLFSVFKRLEKAIRMANVWIMSLIGKTPKRARMNYEETIKRYENKITIQKGKINELHDKIEKHQRDIAQRENKIQNYSQELENATQNLDEAKRENEDNKKCLSFLSEILSAKDSDEHGGERLKKIKELYDYVRGDVYDLYNKYNRKNAIETTGLERWFLLQKKEWIEGKATCAFVGHFSAGKTTLINNLLHSWGVESIPMPTELLKPTTAIPTYISYGEADGYRYVSKNNKLKIISADTFLKMTKDVLGKIDGLNNVIECFVRYVKNEKLRHLSILDTPGYAENEETDKITDEAISECDYLFWVIKDELDKSSKITIKNIKKPLYVILTFCDRLTDGEKKRRANSIKEYLPGIEIKKFFYTSNKDSKTLDDLSRFILDLPAPSKDSFIEDIVNSLCVWEKEADDFVEKAKKEWKEKNKIVSKEMGSVAKIDMDKINSIENAYKEKYRAERCLKEQQDLKKEIGDIKKEIEKKKRSIQFGVISTKPQTNKHHTVLQDKPTAKKMQTSDDNEKVAPDIDTFNCCKKLYDIVNNRIIRGRYIDFDKEDMNLFHTLQEKLKSDGNVKEMIDRIKYDMDYVNTYFQFFQTEEVRKDLYINIRKNLEELLNILKND